MSLVFVFILIILVWALCLFYYFQRNDILYKLVALFVITCVCEFLKRFIYIFGDVGGEPYYMVLFIPDSIILLDMLIVKKFRKPVLFLILFIAFMTLIALLYGQSIIQVAIMLRTVFLPIALMFLISRSDSNVTLLGTRSINMSHIIITVCLSSVYGASQYFFDYPVWEYNWDAYSPANMSLTQITRHWEVNRGFGFFSEVSGQGLSISVVMLYIIFNFKKSILKYFLLLVLFVGLITSFSKTAFVALLFTLMFWKLAFFLKRWIIFLSALGVVALANSREIIYTLIEFVRSTFSGALLSSLDPATLLSRVVVINNFFENMTIASALFGSGFAYESGITMDNLFIYIIYKCGFLGLIVFGYFFSMYISKSSVMGKQSTFVFSALIFILIFSMTTINITARSGVIMLLIIFEIARRSIDFNTIYRGYLR